MTNPIIQIDDEIREMTTQEIAKLESDRADMEAIKADEITSAALRNEAKAGLIARLGLSEEEARLLLS
jgi:hypothetical protein